MLDSVSIIVNQCIFYPYHFYGKEINRVDSVDKLYDHYPAHKFKVTKEQN